VPKVDQIPALANSRFLISESAEDCRAAAPISQIGAFQSSSRNFEMLSEIEVFTES